MAEEEMSKSKAVRTLFATITVREIKEIMDTDPEGYAEMAKACQEHYAEIAQSSA